MGRWKTRGGVGLSMRHHESKMMSTATSPERNNKYGAVAKRIIWSNLLMFK
jgi:hypothetical protein